MRKQGRTKLLWEKKSALAVTLLWAANNRMLMSRLKSDPAILYNSPLKPELRVKSFEFQVLDGYANALSTISIIFSHFIPLRKLIDIEIENLCLAALILSHLVLTLASTQGEAAINCSDRPLTNGSSKEEEYSDSNLKLATARECRLKLSQALAETPIAEDVNLTLEQADEILQYFVMAAIAKLQRILAVLILKMIIATMAFNLRAE
ncbi:uncharacterized protein TRIADDRAFT_54220 [Trichoplax adhaerens]|uniref:Uncharacterized protein n=1 Tax=Trichoplax adhaerens TaxID=10228 RepID=B3RRF7_TRIAD|nr:predicted protein [Trichoplax adhaerens]EDV26337.1 predicted protein [Trichoplax adhaerens]|eukprot:XP_002110333.1 predicted protein [Trichoplax adhaerens]